jgi:hypothetical protein
MLYDYMICDVFGVVRGKRPKEKLTLTLDEIESDKTFATSIEIGQPIRKLAGKLLYMKNAKSPTVFNTIGTSSFPT